MNTIEAIDSEKKRMRCLFNLNYFIFLSFDCLNKCTNEKMFEDSFVFFE